MQLAFRALLVLLTVDAVVLGIAIRRYFNARHCDCARCQAGLDHDATPFASPFTKPTLDLILPELTAEPAGQAQPAHAG